MMMFGLAVFATLLTTMSALVIRRDETPQLTTGGVNPLFPECVEVAFYQGTISSDITTCGVQVSNGTIETEYCNSLCTAGIAIARAPNNHCTFTVYAGSSSCDVNDGGEKVSHPIPAEEGSVCLSTGVEDGCDFQSASGVWSCS